MTMPGQDFAAMTTGASALGTASGTMVTGLPAMMGGLGWADVHWAQFDFSKGANKMTQELTTNGWAANIGFTWKATPALTIGGVYHAKTSLKDMSGNGQLVMQGGNGAGVTVSTIGVTGKLKVVNFQWPETFGFGMAYQVNDKTTIVADYKRINWASVMKNFRMDFVADGTGATMTAVLFQDWKDQNVYMIGGAYKYTEALTLRAGVNIANNPVPSKYMNYLFPATVKNTLALGFGYSLSPAASIDFSYTYAPDVSVTNNNSGIKTTHGQSNNWQAMYSHRF
jgi:long-chain fatty acid transport protein